MLIECEEPEMPIPVDDIESWRPIVFEARVLCNLRGIDGFGNFTPLWTNGILVQIKRLDGSFHLVHLENVVWPAKPKKERIVSDKPHATRKTKSTLNLSSLSLETLLA